MLPCRRFRKTLFVAGAGWVIAQEFEMKKFVECVCGFVEVVEIWVNFARHWSLLVEKRWQSAAFWCIRCQMYASSGKVMKPAERCGDVEMPKSQVVSRAFEAMSCSDGWL